MLIWNWDWPQNIMMDSSANFVLVDWGLSEQYKDQDGALLPSKRKTDPTKLEDRDHRGFGAGTPDYCTWPYQAPYLCLMKGAVPIKKVEMLTMTYWGECFCVLPVSYRVFKGKGHTPRDDLEVLHFPAFPHTPLHLTCSPPWSPLSARDVCG